MAGLHTRTGKRTTVDDWQATRTVTERNLYMLENEIATDVTFSVVNNSFNDSGEAPVTIKAHKYMVLAASPVFAAMFSGRFAQPDVIEVTDVEPGAFKQMLRFIYSDEAQISHNYVLHILYSAKKYGIPRLLKVCQQFLETQVNASNACILYEHCKVLDEDALAQKCLQFVLEDTASAFDSKAFLEISQTTLQDFLARDGLSIPEREVFNGCVKWAVAKLTQYHEACSGEAIRRVLGPALFHIRFPTLSMDDFANYVSKSKVLTEGEELTLYRYLATTTKPETADVGFPVTPRTGACPTADYFLTDASSIDLLPCSLQNYSYNGNTCFELSPRHDIVESLLVVFPMYEQGSQVDLRRPKFVFTADLQLRYFDTRFTEGNFRVSACMSDVPTEVRKLSDGHSVVVGRFEVKNLVYRFVKELVLDIHVNSNWKQLVSRQGPHQLTYLRVVSRSREYSFSDSFGRVIKVTSGAQTANQQYPVHVVGIRFGRKGKE